MSDTKPTKEEREQFIKKMEDEAAKQGRNLSEYIADTGGDEIREILQRMIKAELQIKKDAQH